MFIVKEGEPCAEKRLHHTPVGTRAKQYHTLALYSRSIATVVFVVVVVVVVVMIVIITTMITIMIIIMIMINIITEYHGWIGERAGC